MICSDCNAPVYESERIPGRYFHEMYGPIPEERDQFPLSTIARNVRPEYGEKPDIPRRSTAPVQRYKTKARARRSQTVRTKRT